VLLHKQEVVLAFADFGFGLRPTRRSGSHGESVCSEEAELGLLRVHWIIGPAFVDRKSLATMSNTAGVGG
jgi:hypothetical protein